jgi:putative glycosyltransferase
MKLSIVTTLYYSVRHVEEFCDRTLRTAQQLSGDCELILVNDGSPDESLAAAIAVCGREPRVRVLDLSRHYGHYPALLAGLAAARGDRVFLIDCDLEEPPEILLDLWAQLEADAELDAVVAVQRRRRGGLSGRVFGAAFYWLLALSTDGVIADNLVARLMTRRYVDALLSLREQPVSLDVLAAVAGFRQKTLPTDKQPSRDTTYPLGRKVRLAAATFIAYGTWMSTAMFLVALGMMIAGAAIAVAAARTEMRMVLASIWFVGGVVLAGLALLRLSLAQLAGDVRRRPTIVRREYSRSSLENR